MSKKDKGQTLNSMNKGISMVRDGEPVVKGKFE